MALFDEAALNLAANWLDPLDASAHQPRELARQRLKVLIPKLPELKKRALEADKRWRQPVPCPTRWKGWVTADSDGNLRCLIKEHGEVESGILCVLVPDALGTIRPRRIGRLLRDVPKLDLEVNRIAWEGQPVLLVPGPVSAN